MKYALFVFLFAVIFSLVFVFNMPITEKPADQIGPLVGQYVKAKGIQSFDEMQVGQTTNTCSFVVYQGRLYLGKHIYGAYPVCIAVRRDSDGYVAILPLDRRGIWEESDTKYDFIAPVRVEYVDTIKDVQGKER